MEQFRDENSKFNPDGLEDKMEDDQLFAMLLSLGGEFAQKAVEIKQGLVSEAEQKEIYQQAREIIEQEKLKEDLEAKLPNEL